MTSRKRLSRQLAASGASPESVAAAKLLCDRNTLTLGFARRFAPYKRPNLLLHDPERLLRLLTNPQRPVQIIMAGKAHPADQAYHAQVSMARPAGDYTARVIPHLDGVAVLLKRGRYPMAAMIRWTNSSMKKPAKPRVLTINGGSSSIKFAQFEVGDALCRILEGGIERIGRPEACLRVTGLKPMDNFSRPVTAPDHTVAVGILMDWFEAHGRDPGA